nr:hypothetical protein [Tanacetum cinerariifolium]
GVGYDASSDGDALSLATTQHAGALSDLRMVAFRQCLDEVMRVTIPACFLHNLHLLFRW